MGPLLLIPNETNDLATFELLLNFHGKIRNQFYFLAKRSDIPLSFSFSIDLRFSFDVVTAAALVVR